MLLYFKAKLSSLLSYYFKPLLIFFLPLLLCGIFSSAHASDYLESTISYQNSKGLKKIKIYFPKDLSEHSQALLIKLSKKSLIRAEEILGVPLEDNTDVYFDGESNFHNGLSTVLPQSRIYVHLAAPKLGSGLGIYRNYLFETLIHEWAHMIAIQSRAGLFRVLGWFFGNSSSPNSSWPRWLHEGLAVWAEKQSFKNQASGRPHFGTVDMDLRRYAEYIQRKKQDPLSARKLDAQKAFYKIHSGTIPYHFGYWLVNEWLKANNLRTPASFINDSSNSFGFSFRRTMNTRKVSIDELRKNLYLRSKSLTLNKASQKRKEVASATQIYGLNRFFHKDKIYFSWIEKKDTNQFSIITYDPKLKIKKTKIWKHKNFLPRKIAKVDGEFWLASAIKNKSLLQNTFYDPFEKTEEQLLLMSKDFNVICTFNLKEKLKDFSFNKDSTLTLTLKSDLEKWHIITSSITKNCLLKNKKWHAFSRTAFERLSNAKSHKKIIYSRARALDSSQEEIVFGNKVVSAKLPLIQAAILPKNNSACSNCFLAATRSKENINPVLVKLDEGRAFHYPSKTGYTEYTSDGKDILLLEKLWDKDVLYSLPLLEYSSLNSFRVKQKTTSTAIRSRTVPHKLSQIKTKNYSALGSLLPSFWYPLATVIPGGFFIGGQSFFEDIRRRWGGSLTLAYDSTTKKPLALSQLYRKNLGLGIFHTASVFGNYAPNSYPTSGGAYIVQNKWNAGINLAGSAYLSSHWRSRHGLKLSYVQASSTASLPAYKGMIGSISHGISSHHGRSEHDPALRLGKQKSGLNFSQRLSFFKNFAYDASLFLQFKISKTGFGIGNQFGISGRHNFPAISYEFGGIDTISFFNNSYLTRGFPSRFFSFARKIVRHSVYWGFNLFDFDKSLSWNRLGISSIDLKFLAEATSYDSYNINSPFKLGLQYFASSGLELDTYFRFIHYTNIKSSFGVYKGFGKFGEWRWALKLSSSLSL